MGLFSNIGTGVKDFFYEPAQGLVKSPEEFGKGLAKGSVSLAKHTTYGLFNTVSKLTGTAGKGLATLSFDDDYLKQRKIRQTNEKPKHVGEGLLYGTKSLGQGIFNGVTGIVTQPIKGAKKDGALGFAKGFGRGIIGYLFLEKLTRLEWESNQLWVLQILSPKQVKEFAIQQLCLMNREDVIANLDTLALMAA